MPLDDADPARLRLHLSTGRSSPRAFRDALLRVPRRSRDGWVDRVLGLSELPADGPELPRGCVPYLPCPVDTLLSVVELAEVGPADVFVDVGSGVGRAMALTHLLTGAGTTGIEIQSALVRACRELSSRLNAPRVTVIEGDAVRFTRYVMVGSVFFLYCPFSGERLESVLEALGRIAKTRPIRVCSVDLPLPARPWLVPAARSGGLLVHRSVC